MNKFFPIFVLLYFGFAVECEDIEFDYDQLHSGNYAECIFNQDCMAVWGHCDVGLGGCHYAVNEENYPDGQISELVSIWLEEDCMEWVCDCSALPNVQCLNNYCQLAYCYDPNPEGCFNSGCPDGYECIDDPNYCVPSSCGCDEFYGEWTCTEDCGGGTCVQMLPGDMNDDNELNVLDIILIVNIILSNEYNNLADINNDETINVLDIVQLVNIILNPTFLPEDCYIEPEVGPCDGICPTYFYNHETNQCEEFITGCCGVEAFDSMEECQNICE